MDELAPHSNCCCRYGALNEGLLHVTELALVARWHWELVMNNAYIHELINLIILKNWSADIQCNPSIQRWEF